jgi:hypothetical protein
MYARNIRFTLGPDTEWEAQHMANVMFMYLKQQPGFIQATFLMDYESGEYNWISFWDNQDCAKASHSNLYPKLLEMIGDKFQWEPSLQFFEVYSPT